jgi:ADP-ribose pyrophosphatase YjhB (NUDIX family)
MTKVRTQHVSGGTDPRALRSPDAEARGAHQHYQAIVDIHLLLMRERRVLLGRRVNTGYGDGAYEPPSSRLAERETIVEAAIRVAAAQTGIELIPSHVALAHVMHDVSGAGRIAFFLTADGWAGEPGCDAASGGSGSSGTGNGTAGSYSDFDWFDVDDLPANMIDRARVAIRHYAAGAGFSTYPAFAVLFLLIPPYSSKPRPGGPRYQRR